MRQVTIVLAAQKRVKNILFSIAVTKNAALRSLAIKESEYDEKTGRSGAKSETLSYRHHQNEQG